MIEIRFHGRGGQGAVIASKILANALFKEGKFVQSFPAFGVERRGAPVTALLRVDENPILLRCHIYQPDHLVVLDSSLFSMIDVVKGLKEKGIIVINTNKKPSDFPELVKKYRVATIDASGIAVMNRLGTKMSPIVNTAICGAFIKATKLASLESVNEAVREEVPIKKEANVRATTQAYEQVEIL